MAFTANKLKGIRVALCHEKGQELYKSMGRPLRQLLQSHFVHKLKKPQ